MVGWPLYNLGKSLHRRGRLPDMKPARVTASVCVVAGVLLFVFLVPLPVSRVREAAVVQLQPEVIQKVFVPIPQDIPVVLEKLHVRDGQEVQEGQILAEFSSRELNNKLREVETQAAVRRKQVEALERQRDDTNDPKERDQIRVQIATLQREASRYAAQARGYSEIKHELRLQAPRAGVVMNPPRVDAVGTLWQHDEPTPFCSIGDPSRLRAVVPVTPSEIELLRSDRQLLTAQGKDLEATIRVQGREHHTWQGEVETLPLSEAKEIPADLRALANRYGGPVAVKADAPNDALVPQAQQYLVSVNFINPDRAIAPGAMAQVKIHCRWQTCAWWAWRKINDTFDLGLL
jgi:putative peptide zinc metalloprotease protein